MTERSMIQRVAHEIYHATPRNKPFDKLSEVKRAELTLQARAAARAFKYPTEKMLDAATAARLNIMGGYGGPGYWEAAIDAALSEERAGE